MTSTDKHSGWQVLAAVCGLALLNLLIFSFVRTQAQSDLPPPPAGITHVLLISADGLRPDAVFIAEMPNLLTLAERGAAAWTAQTISPPGTLPAHASMLTGLSPAAHGVDWNATNPGCPPIESPTFLLLAAEAGYATSISAGKEKFCHFVQSDAITYTFAREGDRSVVDAAIERLEAGDQVLFVHLPNPDYFGHARGWMSETYISELANTDRQLGRLLEALDALGIADSTLVIFTSDHGGIGDNHGVEVPETMTVPWIIAGPGVLAGSSLDRFALPVSVLDTAPTILWALGLPLPDNLDGRPLLAAFEGDA